ncbi:hypothetical protein F4861DRAFT_36017 [Xylaria intraflava]|nr:hypothetical protein F4861DRAFT_36017 [Xylaria intraflava]
MPPKLRSRGAVNYKNNDKQQTQKKGHIRANPPDSRPPHPLNPTELGADNNRPQPHARTSKRTAKTIYSPKKKTKNLLSSPTEDDARPRDPTTDCSITRPAEHIREPRPIPIFLSRPVSATFLDGLGKKKGDIIHSNRSTAWSVNRQPIPSSPRNTTRDPRNPQHARLRIYVPVTRSAMLRPARFNQVQRQRRSAHRQARKATGGPSKQRAVPCPRRAKQF